MGVSLRSVIEQSADASASSAPRITSVLMGVSNALISAGDLDVAVSYESMKAIGSGLGSASFIVIGDGTDGVELAAGVSRFLAVESCGQCTACKQDGLKVFDGLQALVSGDATELHVLEIRDRLRTVTDGARCGLAGQQQLVIGSILDAFEDDVESHLLVERSPGLPFVISALDSLEMSGDELDRSILLKRPDWTYAESNEVDESEPLFNSCRSPAERMADLQHF